MTSIELEQMIQRQWPIMNMNQNVDIEPNQKADHTDYSIVNQYRVATKSLLHNEQIPALDSVRIISHLSLKWFDAYCQLSGIPLINAKSLIDILSRSEGELLFATMYEKKEVVACGHAIVTDGVVGIYNVVVSKKHHNHGYGEQLIIQLLQQGSTLGATMSFSVYDVLDSKAQKGYEKLGFVDQCEFSYRIPMLKQELKIS